MSRDAQSPSISAPVLRLFAASSLSPMAAATSRQTLARPLCSNKPPPETDACRSRQSQAGSRFAAGSSCASARVTSPAAPGATRLPPMAEDGRDRRVPRGLAGGVPGARRRAPRRRSATGRPADRPHRLDGGAGTAGEGRDRRPGDGRTAGGRPRAGADGLQARAAGPAIIRRPDSPAIRRSSRSASSGPRAGAPAGERARPRARAGFNQRYALLCRDYLRADPAAAAAYAAVKRALAGAVRGRHAIPTPTSRIRSSTC